jgi:low affinity Fe/Cu permease
MTPKKDHSTDTSARGITRIALGATKYIGSSTSLVIHTLLFVGIFSLQWFGFSFDQIMLILTTAVSLEAIYLSIFIQMTVNQHAQKIEEVSDDVEDIGEDVEEISRDIDSIQEDVKEISEDVEEISEDVEDIGEELEKDDRKDACEHPDGQPDIRKMELQLEELLRAVRELKQ